MRKLILLLLFIPLFHGCSSPNYKKKTDLEKLHLRGKVKRVAVCSFSLDSTGAIIDSSLWNNIDSLPDRVDEFNEQGFYTKTMSTLDSMVEIGVYTYNEKKQLIKKETSNGRYYSHVLQTYTYNNAGLATTETLDRHNSFSSDPNSHEIWSIKYTYNKKGWMIKEKGKRKDSSQEYIVLHEYDDHGNIIKTVHINTETNYEFKSTIVFKYDANGNELYSERTDDNEANRRSATRTYDNSGNVLTEVGEYNSTSYIYLFDKTGNWVQVTVKNNNEVSNIVRRKITYWE